MIKITYKGFQIEVDSIEDAKKIINMGEKQLSPWYPQTDAPKKVKKYMKNPWTADEMYTLIGAIKSGNEYGIIKDEIIRTRHSRKGIKQMLFKIKHGTNKNISELVSNIIQEFHRSNPRKLLVNSVTA